MDEEKTTETNEEQRNRETKDTSTDDLGSESAYGPPSFGERGDPKRDPESGVPREEPGSEPGDLAATDDPNMGKESRGG